MNKRASAINTIIIILLLGVIGFSAYYLYQNMPGDPINLKTLITKQPLVNNSIPSKQFYDRMRYPDRKISYYISESCPKTKYNYMVKAFQEIDSKTILSFSQTSKENAEISVLCSDVSPTTEERGHFVAGEGGPSKIINSTLYSIILEGKIALYRESSCKNSNVAIHELLHTLGFDHNNNPKSILYPTLNCDQTIDQEIIDSIDELYEADSLPDLAFDSLNVTKKGRYLDFNMNVVNQGLDSANNIQVGVYADNKFVQSFDLNSISIGAKKIVNVENLKIPIGAKKIEFIIDYNNQISELFENNNKIEVNTA